MTGSHRGWLAVGLALTLGIAGLSCRQAGVEETVSPVIGDGGEWHLVGGTWKDGDGGAILPPPQLNNYYAAFLKDHVFSNLTAEFEFRPEYRGGDAGLVVCAQDPQRYLWVHFPWVGQQVRAKHFWAAISRVDGSGMVRIQRFSLVPGVPSEYESWYRVKVRVRGSKLRVWVNERALPPFKDPNLIREGRIGLVGYNKVTFRDFRIQGQSRRVTDWQASVSRPRNWFFPVPEAPQKDFQYMRQTIWGGNLARTPGGDLLMEMAFQIGVNPERLGTWGPSLQARVRSTDNGRSWSEPETLAEVLTLAYSATEAEGEVFLTSDGRLIRQRIRDKKVFMSASTDDGKTWAEWEEVPSGKWPDDNPTLGAAGPLLELEDGTLVRNLAGGHISSSGNVFTWGSHHAQGYSIRSLDGGATWSSPVPLDNTKEFPLRWSPREIRPQTGNLDLTEVASAEVSPGKIPCLIRPIYSLWMWETWSTDGGAGFGPSSRSQITGYGAPQMLKTASGALVIMKRYPDLSVNISWDGGLHWDPGTIIDFPRWANGKILEVEPDVVLFVYMSGDYPPPGKLRAQLLRVTRDGLQPLQ